MIQGDLLLENVNLPQIQGLDCQKGTVEQASPKLQTFKQPFIFTFELVGWRGRSGSTLRSADLSLIHGSVTLLLESLGRGGAFSPPQRQRIREQVELREDF